MSLHSVQCPKCVHTSNISGVHRLDLAEILLKVA